MSPMSIFGPKSQKRSHLPKLRAPEADRVRSFVFPLFWGADDAELVKQRVGEAIDRVQPGVHFADNFFTWARNNSMLDDEEFVKAWESNAESDADRAIVWRRYVLACAAYHCVQLEGDFVECGAYTGVGVKTVVDYLGGTTFPKTFWLYDAFEHEEWMLHHAGPEHGPELEGRVRAKFGAYPQVRIYKGLIPEVLEGQSPETIAYLHIDLNEAPGEVAALDVLFERVVPGGIVILDDYEWSMYRAQKLAEDPWFESRQYRVFPLRRAKASSSSGDAGAPVKGSRCENPRIPGQGNLPQVRHADAARHSRVLASTRPSRRPKRSAARSGWSRRRSMPAVAARAAASRLRSRSPRCAISPARFSACSSSRTRPARGPEGAPPADRGGRRHQEGALRRHGRRPRDAARRADGELRGRDGHRGSRRAYAGEDPQGIHRSGEGLDRRRGRRRRPQDRHSGRERAAGAARSCRGCIAPSTKRTPRSPKSIRSSSPATARSSCSTRS